MQDQVNPEWWERAVAGVCSHGGHGWNGETCSDAPVSWLDMAPADFDASPVPVQGALFAEPDRLGTEPMFGDQL
jgi:hypothetical protein